MQKVGLFFIALVISSLWICMGVTAQAAELTIVTSIPQNTLTKKTGEGNVKRIALRTDIPNGDYSIHAHVSSSVAHPQSSLLIIAGSSPTTQHATFFNVEQGSPFSKTYPRIIPVAENTVNVNAVLGPDNVFEGAVTITLTKKSSSTQQSSDNALQHTTAAAQTSSTATPQAPQQQRRQAHIPETGSGHIVGAFVGSSILGYILYLLRLRHKTKHA